MKRLSPKSSFSFRRILCFLFGHDYIITNKVTNHINEYKCTHCGKEVTDNASGYLEDLTFTNKKINANLATFYQKKNSKKLRQTG